MNKICITGFITCSLLFSATFAVEDDNIGVTERVNTIQQSDDVFLPNIGNRDNKKGLISNVLTRLFNPTGQIRSVFIEAFRGLSVNTLPLWNGSRFIDSAVTQSGNILNIAGDVNISGDLYKNTNTFTRDIWEETGSGIYYLNGGFDVGIGVSNPQSKLDVAGSIIVGDTSDVCNTSKFGSIRFRNNTLEYCGQESFAWVVGNWSDWSGVCGSATRTRSVDCQSPSGSIDASGALCTGPEPTDTDASSQGNSTCGWSGWSDWSTTCGDATRTRTCSTGVPGSAHCAGSATDSSNQGSSTCGWNGWGGYGSCSTTCGTGTQSRTRTCATGAPGSTNCSGSATSSTSCTAGSSTCGWSSWGAYGACSATCGTGSRSRTRSCLTGTPGSANCAGSNSSSQSCTNGVIRTYDASVPRLSGVRSNYAHENVGVTCADICKREYGSSSTCHAPGTQRLHGYLPNRNNASQSVASHWIRQSYSTISLSCSDTIRPGYNDCPSNGWNSFTVPWCAHLSTNRAWGTDSTNTCVCCDK